MPPCPPPPAAPRSWQGCDAARGVQGPRRRPHPRAGGAPHACPAAAGGAARRHGRGGGQPRRWGWAEWWSGRLESLPAAILGRAVPWADMRSCLFWCHLQPSACWWTSRGRRRSCWRRCAAARVACITCMGHCPLDPCPPPTLLPPRCHPLCAEPEPRAGAVWRRRPAAGRVRGQGGGAGGALHAGPRQGRQAGGASRGEELQEGQDGALARGVLPRNSRRRSSLYLKACCHSNCPSPSLSPPLPFAQLAERLKELCSEGSPGGVKAAVKALVVVSGPEGAAAAAADLADTLMERLKVGGGWTGLG